MPIQILMPALSPTMTEGNLAKWLVAEGDNISSGDVIAEIETDKATMEVEAVDEGVLGRILVAEGTEGVAVNTPIGLLLEEGESESDLGDMPEVPPSSSAPEPSTEAAPPAKPETSRSSPASSASANTASKPAAKPAGQGGRVHASPLARRLAKDAGIDLSLVDGTGPHGRIVKKDVEKAKSEGTGKAPATQAVGRPMPSREDRDIPNSNVRKVIARRLSEAKREIPHFYLSVDCEIDSLLDLRKQVNATSPEGEGAYKVSVNDFIIKAVAQALREVPAANASWNDDAIRLYGDVDVSVAVATPNGLMTPIIRQADLKSVVKISEEMKDLAGRARDGKLKPEEFQGGGFTISNLGMYGISTFSAIINPPQSCILAVGAGEQRPIVRDGELAIATMMTCTLSVDHRSVDGAVGAEFLGAFKKLVHSPLKLLL